MIALGLAELRLAPDAFWALTPRELAALVAGRAGRAAPTPMTRRQLADLARRHPDEETTHDQSG